MSYEWYAGEGDLSATGAGADWTSPAGLTADAAFEITVTISDPEGNSVTPAKVIEVLGEPLTRPSDTLVLDPDEAVCELNDTITFIAILVREDGTEETVEAEWSVFSYEGGNIGTVDQATGIFSPHSEGSGRVVASYGDLTVEAEMMVYDFNTNPMGGTKAIPLPEGFKDMEIASGGSWSFQETSEFFIGSVSVHVVFIESNGGIEPNLYNWSAASKTQAEQEIQTGYNWYASYEPKANLTYVFSFETFLSKYEPVTKSSTKDHRYVKEYMLSKGYNYVGGSDQWTALVRTFQFNDDLRTANNTVWAVTIFVVTGKPKFTNGRSAYAYLYGPYMMMTEENGGWSLNRMDQVTSHENGHLFGALDEYNPACSDCTKKGGYLQGANSNCYLCPGAIPNSMMRNCWWFVSDPTRVQLGWRDSDGDDVFDPVDAEWGGSSSIDVVPPTATVAAGTDVDIMATLYNFKGHTIPEATVNFSTNNGSVTPTTDITYLEGEAETTLTADCNDNTVTVSTDGASDEQSVVTGTGACAGNPEPQNPAAVVNCPDVDLTWDAGDDPATYDRYTVKRGTVSGGPYAQIATGLSATSYTDIDPGDGTYYYVILAYESGTPANQTINSDEVTAVVACAIPAGPCPGWKVNTNADSGDGSLRSCIIEANTTAGANTITFDNSLIGQNIGLLTGLPSLTDDATTIENTTGGTVTVDGDNLNLNCITIESANNRISGLNMIECGNWPAGNIKPGYALLITGAAATQNEISGNIFDQNERGIYVENGAN
ncbi:hypothetical protein ACFLQK_02925, partial [bacterium]